VTCICDVHLISLY